MGEQVSELDHAIYQTVRYFDLFQQPITTIRIWRTLIHEQHGPTRWSGHRVCGLNDIRQALTTSPFLQAHLVSQWGHWVLAGKAHLVPAYFRRHKQAQDKWRLTQRLTKVLRLAPFVRGIAMSGSLAAGNTDNQSDLDLFVIVKAGRIWTARLFLLIISEATGHRRRYWHAEAPDKICLNHYITDKHLTMPRDVRNLYTAMLYHVLLPLTGLALFQKFRAANTTWTKRYLMFPEEPLLPNRHALKRSRLAQITQRAFEALLIEPLFRWFESWAETIQRRSIARHTRPRQPGRINLSATELAFHPDTKVPAILAKFYQEEGQQSLL